MLGSVVINLDNRKLTEDELEEEVEIALDETETEIYFKIYGTAATEESDNIDLIKEINYKYDKLIADREGNEKYMDRAMQSFNNAMKTKETYTLPPGANDKTTQSSTYRLWDAFNARLGLE
jgi:3-dehydroquinate synthetase